MITPEKYGQLARYIETDFAKMQGDAKRYLATDEAGVHAYIEQLPPALIIPVSRIGESRAPILEHLNHLVPYSDNPLADAWFNIRFGDVGSEGLAQVTEELPKHAPKYARAMVDQHFALRNLQNEAGESYRGYRDFLTQHGYGAERIQSLLMSAKQAKDTHFPHVTEAADIQKSDLIQSDRLVDSEAIQAALQPFFPNGIPEVIYKGFDPDVASTMLTYTIDEEGNLYLKGFIVRGPEVTPEVMDHERLHLLSALLFAQRGQVATAIFPLGAAEVMATALSGTNVNEALFLTTCIKSAWDLAGEVDQICQEIPQAGASEEEYRTRLAEKVIQFILAEPTIDETTGLKPVPGSGIVPLGALNVAQYMATPEALTVIETVKEKGGQPKIGEILDTVLGQTTQSVPLSGTSA